MSDFDVVRKGLLAPGFARGDDARAALDRIEQTYDLYRDIEKVEAENARLRRIEAERAELADERNRYAQEADEWEKNCIRLRHIEEAARELAALDFGDIRDQMWYALAALRAALEGVG